MIPRRAAFVVGVLWLVVCHAPAPQAVDLRNVLNGYSLTTWGTNDGLPTSEVLAIAQDADGFLWLGTDGGLVRFDGTRFTAQPDHPQGRSVRALQIGSNGDVWVGLGEHGGVVRYRRSRPGILTRLDHHDADEGLDVGAVRALVEDADGTIRVGHLGGLFSLSGGRWAKSRAAGLQQAEVHSLAVDREGRLLVGTRHGVLRSTTAERTAFEPIESGPTREEVIGDLSVDAQGDVWRTDGVHGFQGRIGHGAPLVPPEIARGSRLLHDRAGHLWVGTGGQGLWRVSQRADGRLLVEQSTVTTGLLGNGVVSVFEDRDGNIWAGTLDGLNRLTQYVATPIQGLGLVSGIERSPQGLWVMTADSLRLFPRDGALEAPLVQYEGDVRAMHVDEAGRLWMSTGDRLWWFDRDGRHELPLAGAPLRSIALIASDRQDGLWLYDTEQGLHRRTGMRITTAAVPTGLQRARLTWMDTTAAGELWIATADGRVARVAVDGRVDEYGPASGLDSGVVRAWHLGRDGTVWLGAAEGLTRFKDGRFATLRETHGHRLEALTAIVEGTDGQLWAGTRSGLLRVAADDLDRHLEAPGQPVPLAHLTKGDGLAGNPRWYGHRGAIRDAGGRIWFVTSRGLSVVDPERIAGAQPVDASVDTVVVDGHVTSHAHSTLVPGTKRLDIQFAALALTSPSTIRFRYRLDGFDPGWVDAGSRRHASYTNLPPGDYRFYVMATNTDGTWPDRAASWSFVVRPHFYQTTWFAFACVAGGLAIVALVWRLHLRRVRAEMAILLAERARVAREIHDTLLQGLFGVALRCDAIAAEVETSAPQVSQHFVELRRGVEQYVREARQSILGLRSPALERLGLAAALRATGEQLTAGTHVRFAFESIGTQRSCSTASEEHLLRIGQEAIINAVRHARATAIRAELRYTGDGIVLQVADDGHGVDPDAAERAGGLGLASMRERARAAGGVVHIHSRAGHGTRIEVKMPYEPSNAAA